MGGQLHLHRQSNNILGKVQTLQAQARPVIERPANGFPWGSIDLGYQLSGNTFIGLAGEFQFQEEQYAILQSPLAGIAEALVVANDNTWAYIECGWGTGSGEWKLTTVKANTKPTIGKFRKWFYLLGYAAPTTVWIRRWGFQNPYLEPVLGK